MDTKAAIIKALPLMTPAERKALKRIAREAALHPRLERLVAFGSRIRGDFHGDSDLDILVLVRDITAKDEIIAFLYRIETEYDVPLAPVIYTVAEYETNRRLGSRRFVENVEKEGVVLYDAQRAGKE
jgi:predicted nucleotidyltransferase